MNGPCERVDRSSPVEAKTRLFRSLFFSRIDP
jgi:hypothetical protein